MDESVHTGAVLSTIPILERDDVALTRAVFEKSTIGPDLEVGTIVGKFAIISELGRGGMGIVYLGHDAQLERYAAIKVVCTDSPIARARMIREARAMARLSHPNVVQVYEVGEHGSDVYVAMEFVDGSSLREWLAAAVRTPADICQRFIEAGRGLAAIHTAGLVHRDFKPDNVMVGIDGRIRVLDLGIAADRGPSNEATGQSVEGLRERPPDALAPTLTGTGVNLGTPAYMAPEQHQGDDVDARTDQFSFCVALWEALYGERPFKGITILALASSVCRGVLPTPPRTNVPIEVHAAIVRGLAVEPDERWPSMDALLGALELGFSELADSKAERIPRRWQRMALALAVGGILVIVLPWRPGEPSAPAGTPVVASMPEQDAVVTGLDEVRAYVDEGDHRQALAKLIDVRGLVFAAASRGSVDYCSVSLATVGIADQIARDGGVRESEMAYAIGIEFARACPYLNLEEISLQREAARVQSVESDTPLGPSSPP